MMRSIADTEGAIRCFRTVPMAPLLGLVLGGLALGRHLLLDRLVPHGVCQRPGLESGQCGHRRVSAGPGAPESVDRAVVPEFKGLSARMAAGQWICLERDAFTTEAARIVLHALAHWRLRPCDAVPGQRFTGHWSYSLTGMLSPHNSTCAGLPWCVRLAAAPRT